MHGLTEKSVQQFATPTVTHSTGNPETFIADNVTASASIKLDGPLTLVVGGTTDGLKKEVLAKTGLSCDDQVVYNKTAFGFEKLSDKDEIKALDSIHVYQKDEAALLEQGPPF